MDIPKKFYNQYDPDYPVVVDTVGDLIAALSELPSNLPVRQGFEDSTEITVFNAASDDPFLEIQEPDHD